MKYLNKKWIAAVCTIALVLGLSACRSTPEERADHISERISSELNLNQQQQVLLNTLKTNALAAGKAMKEDKPIQKIAADIVRDTAKYKYSYHFHSAGRARSSASIST